MKNKTCGECRYYHPVWEHEGVCTIDETLDKACDWEKCGAWKRKEPLSNGDRIRQMSNEGIAAFVCGVLNDRREETFRSVLGLLNAPADCVAENGKSAKQADLCCKSAKESEVKDD